MPDIDPEIEALTDQIKHYIQASDNPADTLEGISQWWLELQHQAVPLARLEQSLQLLVDRGVLLKLTLPDSKTVYRKKHTTTMNQHT